MSDYTIAPIPGREVIQRNFISLPKKAQNYSGRHISLNERFSIIERGYMLLANDIPDTDMEIKKVAIKDEPTRENLKNMLLAEAEKRRQKQKEADIKATLVALELLDSCDSQPESP